MGKFVKATAYSLSEKRSMQISEVFISSRGFSIARKC